MKIDEGILDKDISQPIVLPNGEFVKTDDAEEKSEESDEQLQEFGGFDVIEVQQPIQNLFFSRSSSDYSYLGVLSLMKFTIYYISEDEAAGFEKDIVWDLDYRWNKDVRQYGNIISLDFEDQGR